MRRPGRLPVLLHVAGRALGAESCENARRGRLVAAFARRACVRAQQRKPVEVFARFADRSLEAPDCVALSAIRAELPAVDVGMARRAFVADVAEDRIEVARDARRPCMASTERVRGLRVVIELGVRADGPPPAGGVAAFTGDLQGPVRVSRAPHRLLRGRLGDSEARHQERGKQQEADLHWWHP